MATCFYSKFNLEKYSKIDVSSFRHDGGFGGSSFYSNLNEKNIQKLIFSSFWHDLLGFGGSFFLFKIQAKNNVTKLIFPAFGMILVLVAFFLCSKPMVCHPKKLGVVTASHDKSLSNGSFIKESGLFTCSHGG